MQVKDQIYRIDRQSKLPLYDQIQHNLTELVMNGQLGEGESLPGEFELAEKYGVSRLTVRRAMDELVRQGWLVRKQGVGTFVTSPRVVSITPGKLSFTEEMRAIGRIPSSRMISNRITQADAKIAALLNLKEKGSLIEIVRLRLVDNIPILLEFSYMSYERFPDLLDEPSLESGSLYKFLSEHYRVNITGNDQTLTPALLSEYQAELLEAQTGSPSIVSEIVAFDERSEPIEYSWSIASGGKCEFYFRFRRGEPLL